MPQRKHVKKIRVAPRTDTNQNAREHIERVRKQNEYVIRKLAEYKAKQQAAEEERRRLNMDTSSKTIDGMDSDIHE